MADTFRVFVRGRASSQGSKTGFRRRDGSVGVRPATKTERPWRQLLVDMISEQWEGPPWQGPLELTLRFLFLRPKADKHRVWHTPKPDIDKVLRAVMDALKLGGAIAKDEHVVSSSQVKMSSDIPGVELELRRL